jgi:mono/diheme cytochrome c family protein
MTMRASSAAVLLLLVGCGDGHRHPGGGRIEAPATPTPPQLATGETAYVRHCAECHGERAVGTLRGPPLLHRVYEPSHHPDVAFHLAVTHGVRAHHWRFGDMPRIPNVPPGTVDAIVDYVRWLQREVGIE